MQREHVVLAGVEAEYAEAVKRLGASLSIDVVVVATDEDPPMRDRPPSLFVLGIDGRREEPLASLRRIVKPPSRIPIVVLARSVETDAIVRILREGAADVIGLPADPMEVAARALAPVDAALHTGRGALVGLTSSMRRLREEVASTARSASTVLITGETGTGKGLIARSIHEASGRTGPLVHLDCASLNTALIESELFGHEKGAFTGATIRRVGRFEQAYDGTIFLDEIAELEPAIQAKFLRILQDRLFERIGGTQTLHMNARVLAATNRDLRREISRGRFRADLFYRLSVVEIAVPPLRERLEDLPLLVNAGLDELAARLEQPVPRVTPSFLAELARHHWPGNVRELMNLLERVLVRGGGRNLDVDDLSFSWRWAGEDDDVEGDEPEDPIWHHEPLLPEQERAERTRIAESLRNSAGNVSRTARRLGITRSRLRYRISKYGLMHLIPDD